MILLITEGIDIAAYHSCQTHEGGIAGEPGSEAHGG